MIVIVVSIHVVGMIGMAFAVADMKPNCRNDIPIKVGLSVFWPITIMAKLFYKLMHD